MKKYLIVSSALILFALILCAVPAWAETSGTTNGFAWTADDTCATVTGYTGTSTAPSVPSTLGGKPVQILGESAFADHTDITRVTLPNGLLTIEDTAERLHFHLPVTTCSGC